MARRRIRWPATLAAFAVPGFRRVWTAALLANSGRFALLLVAGWEAYRLGHHSSLWPGLVSFFLLVPSMLLGLFAGGLADRVNRAWQAAAGQLLNVVVTGVAGVLALLGRLDLGLVLVVSAVSGVGNAIQGPAWQAMVPHLVGPDRLRNAGLLTRVAQQGAELSGPAAGTAVLALAGPGPAFLLAAAFYGAGVLLLAQVATGAGLRAGDRRAPIAAPVRSGLRYVRAKEPLLVLLVWVGLHCSLTMASIGILPAVATANLRGSASAYGLLLSAFGLGSMIGPLALAWVGNRVELTRSLVVSAVLSGLPLVALGLTHALWLATLAAGTAGAAQAVFMAFVYVGTQTVSTEELRGRVASVQLSLTTGAMGLASLGWAALVGPLSPGLVLVIPGAVFSAACVPFAARGRRLRAGLAAAGVDAREARVPGRSGADLPAPGALRASGFAAGGLGAPEGLRAGGRSGPGGWGAGEAGGR